MTLPLTRRIWIATIALALIAFVGCAFVSTMSLGDELQRLHDARNRDSATLLALVFTQTEPDPAQLAPIVEVLSRSGDYAAINLRSASGEILAQHRSDLSPGVPAWFAAIAALDVKPAVVSLRHDDRVFATLTVATSLRAAYTSLWQNMLWLALWFAGGAIVTALVCTLALRRLLHPLTEVVAQAEAIGDRRYLITTEPQSPELRAVVRAMNTLSERVGAMSAADAERIGELDRLAGHDELTALPNRSRFLSVLDLTLSTCEPTRRGSIAVLRIADLAGLNRSFGRTATDKLLVDIAARLRGLAAMRPGRAAARLNGSDFILLAPDVGDAGSLADEIAHALAALEAMHGEGLMRRLPVGVVQFEPGESRAPLLARLDGALASSEYGGYGDAHVIEHSTSLPARSDLGGWRDALVSALDKGDIRLDLYPVLSCDGALLHFEAPSRVLIDDLWYGAEAFLAWTERLALTDRLDLAAARIALARIEADQQPLGIHLSARSMGSASFLDALRTELEAHRAAAALLWIELPEQGVVHDLAAFRTLCQATRPYGCKLGIEHAGREFGQLGGLHDIGLDYVKIDAGFVRNISANQDKQEFIARICELAHAIGLQVIAEGVNHADDLETIKRLGLDGMTGSAVRM